MKGKGIGLSLAVVHELRERRAPASAEEVEQFEVDVLAGYVLARASTSVTDATIRGEVGHLEQVRAWFGRPLWEMEPADADVYFGRVLRAARSGTRLARSQALRSYFEFLEVRYKVELHALTGRVVECPIDEVNRPRGTKDARVRVAAAQGRAGDVLHRVGGRSWWRAASSRRARATTRPRG